VPGLLSIGGRQRGDRSVRWIHSCGAARLLGVWAVLSGLASAGVTGHVKDSASRVPIGEAMVSLQASGVRTWTDSDGGFDLSVEGGDGLVIVGAAKGYYNGSVVVDAPAAEVLILLDPVPQANDPSYRLISPEVCGKCHPTQYDEWYGSPMQQAGLNTWVEDIYSGLGTAGGMGGFVYLRDSVFADTNPASECASCHQPERWIADPFSATADPDDPLTFDVVHGVSCEVCHKIADVDPSKINHPGIFPGAVTFTRPAGPEHQAVEYGVLGDVDFRFESYMRASYQPQLVAEACATCHQDANDVNEDHTFSGVVSEPTYLEWAASPYADSGSAGAATCVDCHMPGGVDDQACYAFFPPIPRDPETIRSHDIRGTTPEFLESAVELSMSVSRSGPLVEIDVDVANTGAGHHVPTGVTVRNMILLVEAWGDDDRCLTYTGHQVVHELGGVGDPEQGYYAGRPGKFFAKVNHDAEGRGPTFFTDATGIHFDNRIPALETDTSHYSFAVPGGGGFLKLSARLIYRRAFRFLVDAKGWTEDGHGGPLADVLPPHFGHLMEQTGREVVLVRGDADGDDDADLDDFAHVHACATGPAIMSADPSCAIADDNRDGLVDLRDLASFQLVFGTGG